MKTLKIKKVLIALDYDQTSQKVAYVGYNFAKSIGAEVTLLHIVLDPIFYSSSIIDYINMNNVKLDSDVGVKIAAHYFLDNTKLHLKDSNIKILVTEGDCAQTILKTVEDFNFDVIVMGSHSRKWLEEILLGSVTEDVLKNTKIPLFIVPTKKQH